MSNEKYIVDIGEEGSEGLGKLDYCFNPTTKEFLLSVGLKQAKSILDIGCGSGVMTCWMAEQIGNSGKVVAIESDINQLNAAKRNAKLKSLNNVDFKLCSAYEIETLHTQFDFVYCRFVLHHLHEPEKVIAKIFQFLTSKGIYASEEGIVNYAFSYPFSSAWGDETLRIPPVWQDAPKDQRDGNIGIKMFNKMYSVGFTNIHTQIIHPVLTTRDEKNLLMLGRDELKRYYLEEGHTEEEWEQLGRETEKIVNNDSQIVGFYASCQVAGIKTVRSNMIRHNVVFKIKSSVSQEAIDNALKLLFGLQKKFLGFLELQGVNATFMKIKARLKIYMVFLSISLMRKHITIFSLIQLPIRPSRLSLILLSMAMKEFMGLIWAEEHLMHSLTR